MLPTPLPTHFLENMTFAEVLTDQHAGAVLGYCFGGARPGPNALFATWSPGVNAVSQRLVTLPTLPWMWGRLYLVALDMLKDGQHSDVACCIPDLTFDEVSIFANTEAENCDDKDFDPSYRAVLRMCAGLGMIQGRGVTAQHD